MNSKQSLSVLSVALLGFANIGTANAQESENQDKSLEERIEALEEEIRVVRRENEALTEVAEEDAESSDASEDGITLGGAVRFQYVIADYDSAQRSRGGDLDFDIFRLDFNGKMGDVILSAQYRWFEYMDALRHAYFGYNFTDEWQGQVGVVIQPFGVMPYNSQSYFFSTNFYVGMEDNPGSGLRFLKRTDTWDLDFAFILNDELGGVTGSVRSSADRYNYDVVGIRLPGEGIYDEPVSLAGENNTLMTRIAHKWDLGNDRLIEVGFSGQLGKFNDGVSNVGERQNIGIHALYNTGPWQFQAQYSTYDYDFDIENIGVVVGAYAYFDTMPTKADLYTANVAYSMPVEIGPISNLTFYNNLSVMTNKRGLDDDTVMNVLGMAVTAGGVYTYVDLVTAQNQPFIGGSTGTDGGSTNTRFNINFGYYF
ncbi:hypothetical protein CWE13_11895 [Aliidiomarina shirensis]|uniref:Carbohydrate porin n=1 Tax=Aliidiomarina shirensis TaxID=1048642 RepID=A0A432WKM5_9GAMM|nr:carbohydrate porin [Aliidiomarina shirensis]RUO34324.1 hypothetical protein CWE13_11895 [Aliidiomarina shirensis]